jgi:hypothetical protein
MRRAPHPPHLSGHLLGGLADVGDAILILSIMMGWRSLGPAFRARLRGALIEWERYSQACALTRPR